MKPEETCWLIIMGISSSFLRKWIRFTLKLFGTLWFFIILQTQKKNTKNWQVHRKILKKWSEKKIFGQKYQAERKHSANKKWFRIMAIKIWRMSSASLNLPRSINFRRNSIWKFLLYYWYGGGGLPTSLQNSINSSRYFWILQMSISLHFKMHLEWVMREGGRERL